MSKLKESLQEAAAMIASVDEDGSGDIDVFGKRQQMISIDMLIGRRRAEFAQMMMMKLGDKVSIRCPNNL